MVQDLSITELESYYNLCKAKHVELARMLTAYPGDVKIRHEHDLYFTIKEKIEEEISNRIVNLFKTDEKDLENN